MSTSRSNLRHAKRPRADEDAADIRRQRIVFAFLCLLAAAFVAAWLWWSASEKPGTSQDGPLPPNAVRLSDRITLTVGQRLLDRGVTFGGWEERTITHSAVISLRPDAQPINENDIRVTMEGPGGVKLKDGFVSFPKLQPGESGRLTLHATGSFRDVASILIDLR